MALIEKTVLLKVADRAAYQYNQLRSACDVVRAEGTGYYFDMVTATDDPDVEIPCENVYHNVDVDFDADKMVKWGTNLPSVVGGMEAHFNRLDSKGVPLMVGGWNAYLDSEDERVSYYFAQLFFAVHGYYMNANNVFSESVDQFARITIGTGPVLNFTDGVNYGDGSDLNPANGKFYAATQLKVVVTTISIQNVDIRFSVKDVYNDMKTIDVTIPGGSVPGTVIPVGTSADRFLDVTSAVFKPSGSTGTVGDDMMVINLKERQIVL